MIPDRVARVLHAADGTRLPQRGFAVVRASSRSFSSAELSPGSRPPLAA